MEGMKICSKCMEIKELNEFCSNKNSKDGKMHICKKCNIMKLKEWRKKNPIKVKEIKKRNMISRHLRGIKRKTYIYNREIKLRKCKFCGNIYLKKGKYVYCSKTCAKAGRLEKMREYAHLNYKKGAADLQYYYILRLLKMTHRIIDPNQELLELKRVHISMKRTLWEIKKWRKENESNHTDVSGKQPENEGDHGENLEVHSRRTCNGAA